MTPVFLTTEEVLVIQADQIRRYGGSEGLRDENLLLSALAMPQSGFGGEYLHGDDFEMAAAYLFHIVMNHPFIDGNKRVGAVAARLFLTLAFRATSVRSK
jgi:death-on-curing protein